MLSPYLRDLLDGHIARCVFVRYALSTTCTTFWKRYRNERFLTLMRFLCGEKGQHASADDVLIVLFPNPYVSALQIMQGFCFWNPGLIKRIAALSVKLEEWQKPKFFYRLEETSRAKKLRKLNYQRVWAYEMDFHLDLGIVTFEVDRFAFDVHFEDFRLDSITFIPRVCALFGCMCSKRIYVKKLCWIGEWDATRKCQVMSHFKLQ